MEITISTGRCAAFIKWFTRCHTKSDYR